MNKRTAVNLNTFMVVFLAFNLVACSTVKIKACLPGAAECTVATFRGDSSLESPFVEYERCQGDECVRLIFSADKSTRHAPDVSAQVIEILLDRALGPAE
jgi:hypothetical protein